MKSIYRLLTILCLLLFVNISGNAIDSKRTFKVINASDGLADNSAQTILSLPDGRMVMTTIGYINIYDGIKFTHINTDKGDFYTLPNYTGNYHLYYDSSQRLWLKNKQTVTCVDLLTEQCIDDIEGIFRSEGVKSTVVDLFVDSEGNLWMMSQGRLYSNGKPNPVPVIDAMQLQDMDVLGDSIFLFYSSGEVVCHEISSGREIYRIPSYSADVANGYSRTSVIRRCGRDIIQIRNGIVGAVLQRLDTRTRKWHTIMQLNRKLNNLAELNGILYIPSAYGYWTYDLKTEETIHYDRLSMFGGAKLETDINVIAFDHQGGMWLGTETYGLLYSQPLNSPFNAVSWSDESKLAHHYASMMDTVKLPDLTAFAKNTNCVYTDSRQWTWIGSQTGVELRRTENEDPIYLSRKDGLMNEVVHSIIEDNNHHMWVSTSHGIACIVVANDTIKHIYSYTEGDNIPSETFRNGRAVIDENGIIGMQAIEYVVVFNPNQFTTLDTISIKTRPTLIDVAVNGRELEIGTMLDDKVVLDKAAAHTRYIKLDHDKNTIVLTFSALNYFRPLQTYYRLRIPGIMDEWQTLSYCNSDEMVSANGVLRLPLVGLQSGIYKVELQSSMSPHSWNEEPLIVTIEIDEPWWKTGGLYILFILFLVVLVIANLVYYNRNYRISMKRNSEEWDVLKRLRSYLTRCESYGGEILAPRPDDVRGLSTEGKIDLDESFVEMMLVMAPMLAKDNVKVRELCEKSGVGIKDFYSMVNTNIYKNPRMLARAIRLEQACKLLKETDMSIEDVASECRFVSANYFIASFYGRYRITPKEFRE